mmetsp:Transcript_11528/g.44695  ORF Transcript_11528/g.44695 Transcript_11528/m.44695 type:complete len:598 (+) Transcript_11528:49-1842(+)
MSAHAIAIEHPPYQGGPLPLHGACASPGRSRCRSARYHAWDGPALWPESGECAAAIRLETADGRVCACVTSRPAAAETFFPDPSSGCSSCRLDLRCEAARESTALRWPDPTPPPQADTGTSGTVRATLNARPPATHGSSRSMMAPSGPYTTPAEPSLCLALGSFLLDESDMLSLAAVGHEPALDTGSRPKRFSDPPRMPLGTTVGPLGLDPERLARVRARVESSDAPGNADVWRNDPRARWLCRPDPRRRPDGGPSESLATVSPSPSWKLQQSRPHVDSQQAARRELQARWAREQSRCQRPHRVFAAGARTSPASREQLAQRATTGQQARPNLHPSRSRITLNTSLLVACSAVSKSPSHICSATRTIILATNALDIVLISGGRATMSWYSYLGKSSSVAVGFWAAKLFSALRRPRTGSTLVKRVLATTAEERNSSSQPQQPQVLRVTKPWPSHLVDWQTQRAARLQSRFRRLGRTGVPPLATGTELSKKRVLSVAEEAPRPPPAPALLPETALWFRGEAGLLPAMPGPDGATARPRDLARRADGRHRGVSPQQSHATHRAQQEAGAQHLGSRFVLALPERFRRLPRERRTLVAGAGS